jgi:hypothetical protein
VTTQEMTTEYIDRMMLYRQKDLKCKILIHNVVLLGPRGVIVNQEVRDYAKKYGIDIIQDPTINSKGVAFHV